MNERRLVSVETIADLSSIEGADRIEKARVKGWTVVVKKGDFSVGDKVLYFEIDSQLPLDDDRFAFLAPRGERTLPDGTRVHRLKTARLRGVYSQGLVLPLVNFPELSEAFFDQSATGAPSPDLTEMLGVIKYEPPLPNNLDAAGPFLSEYTRKTDSERIQNLYDKYDSLRESPYWTATEKIDGSSITIVMDDDSNLRVCSRNWELKESDNIYWRAVRQANLENLLLPGDVIQGEVYGEGVQGNPLKVNGLRLAVFSYSTKTYDVVTESEDRYQVPLRVLQKRPNMFFGSHFDDWSDSFHIAPVLDIELPENPDDLIDRIDGLKSTINPDRLAEGVVFHAAGLEIDELDGRNTFKVISRKYLTKVES